MLVLSRKKNESIVINGDITVNVVEIRGDIIRALSDLGSGPSWEKVLADRRNMRSTASLMMAAGRVLAQTSEGWRFIAKEQASGLNVQPLEMLPITCDVDSLMNSANGYRGALTRGHQVFHDNAEPPAFQPLDESSPMLRPYRVAKSQFQFVTHGQDGCRVNLPSDIFARTLKDGAALPATESCEASATIASKSSMCPGPYFLVPTRRLRPFSRPVVSRMRCSDSKTSLWPEVAGAWRPRVSRRCSSH